MNHIAAEDLESIYQNLASREKLRGAEIVITGCAGFLGFYMMQALVRNAARLGVRKVIGLDNFILAEPLWLRQLADVFPRNVEVHKFDIAKDDLRSVAGAARANFVIHMASIASPTFYRQYPLQTIDANVWGLRRLLDLYAGSTELRGLLFFSSSEIYGDPPADAIPTSEEYRGNVACLGPRGCYDESKRFGETLCEVFAKTSGLPITIARPFNNYGPGMRLGDRRLPADLAACIVEGRDIELLSDGSPTRTFCYVSDAVTGYLLCLLHDSFDAFNIGTEAPEITVRQLAEIFLAAGREIFGYQGQIRLGLSSDPSYLQDNPNRRCPVIKKAREKLGYAPGIPVTEGVRRYLDFLKQEGA